MLYHECCNCIVLVPEELLSAKGQSLCPAPFSYDIFRLATSQRFLFANLINEGSMHIRDLLLYLETRNGVSSTIHRNIIVITVEKLKELDAFVLYDR